MYKKCANCYKDGKVPDVESCKKCEDDLKRKELECEELKQTIIRIEDIAENREIFCENCTGGIEDFTCNDCGYVKILQKINEVTNE